MKHKDSREKSSRSKIALKKIEKLFQLAKETYNENPERARKYIKLAREISRKLQVKIPMQLKRSFCKSCNTPFLPGVNCKIRIKRGFKSCKCENCGRIRKFKVY